ncbi:MAG: C25 family cysteine peptidase, partial [Bacteroidota bacterium]
MGNRLDKIRLGDYILFYAEGADKWSYDQSNELFKHEKNLYSDANYVFITVQDFAQSDVLFTLPNLNDPDLTLNDFDEYLFYENESTNILNSGRQWYGEEFSFLNQQSFSFNLNGIVPNADFKINTAVMARDTRETLFELSVNSQSLGEITVAPVSNGTYDFKGQDSELTFQVNQQILNNSENLPLDILFNQQGGNGQGFLNFIQINYPRQLRLYGNQTLFRSAAMLDHDRLAFQFPAPEGEIEIWDVSNPMNYSIQSYSRNNNQIEFTAAGRQIKEYVVFQGGNFPNPEVVGEIANQDLILLDVPNLVIVSPPAFLSEAQRLANFRQTNDGLGVAVVTTDEIYNDYSSGRQDVTAIRNFMGLLYQRDSSRLKYLLLFGDGSFDYKDRVPNNSNWVPIYE